MLTVIDIQVLDLVYHYRFCMVATQVQHVGKPYCPIGILGVQVQIPDITHGEIAMVHYYHAHSLGFGYTDIAMFHIYPNLLVISRADTDIAILIPYRHRLLPDRHIYRPLAIVTEIAVSIGCFLYLQKILLAGITLNNIPPLQSILGMFLCRCL